MNACHSDLRERIAQAYDEGAGSQRALVAHFRVSHIFVERPPRRGDTLVMDNLAVHKVATVREAARRAGARLLHLLPYSPDLCPIEQCWSKVKVSSREAKARTREAPEAAIKRATATVSESDARAWFKHCGCVLH